MKKKLLAILSVAAAATALFAFAACGEKEKEPDEGQQGQQHTHTFEEGWTTDATSHWHKATCDHQEETKDKADHKFQDGKCTVCGYADPNYTPPVEQHTHSFEEGWTYDVNKHWHAAACGHTEEKSGEADHTFKDGKCTVCGYALKQTNELKIVGATLIVTGYEWGPGYNKLVIDFGDNVGGFDGETFYVAFELDVFDWQTSASSKQETPCVITDTYLSNEKGEKTEGESRFVTVEFEAHYQQASPFTYNQVNTWAPIPPVFLQIKEGKSVRVADTEYVAGETIKVESDQVTRIVPQTESWHKDSVTEGKYTLTRASWAPEGAEKDGGKNPLVIWLHGAGEGGEDIDIALLGNEVTALTTENTTNIQHYFAKDGLAGAYVLAVQTPTMWMDDGTGQYNNTGTGKQESCYTAALWKAIISYVEGNPDVDTSRIYLGGCSNGGYMTMNMMFEHGDYFAAFYPICEAYVDSRITDQMIGSVKNYNIWFLLSADDTTVQPAQCEFPTFMRLLKSNAANTHMTLLEHVYATDDPTAHDSWAQVPAGCYQGHYSWVYAFNDQVEKEFPNSKLTDQSQLVPANCVKETNMWEWIASQKKGENHAPTTPDPELPVKPEEPDPGPGGETVSGTVFEFENAVLVDGTAVDQNGNPTPITVESGPVYGGTDVVTNLGYFHSGASATFTITASKECDVTITLHASSAVMDMSQMDWTTWTGMKMAAVDLSKNEYFTFTVNGQQATFTGILPETENASFIDAQCYRHMGTGTVTVHLKAGENVLKFATDTANGSGINLDKITIDAEATLTWTPTDNSSRAQ